MSGPACPGRDQLTQYLGGLLTETDDEAVSAHVEGCATCMADLERLAAATAIPALRAAQVARQASTSWTFLSDLKGLDPKHLSDPPPPRSPAAARLPEIPGYEILGELGRGGAGVVYHARHLTLNRPVAIKMLHPSLFPTEVDRARLRAEADAVARLHHPNVVHLYEVGEVGGVPYLVLEYVDGGTLAAHLAGAPQPPRSAAALVETLARAVHAAHLKHIVHRDLKPANILLQREDQPPAESRDGHHPRHPHTSSFGIPKIADFGLARRLDMTASGLTQTLSGTPAYMSPEQIPDEVGGSPPTPDTPATDVYALGVILYEMVTGRPPFLGADWVTTLLQVVRRAPLRPRELQPGTPRDLETICLKCLEKEPGKRYATAGSLADDLSRFLERRPIRARPVGPLGRMGRWGLRNPVPASLLGALTATGLVAFVAILWQWQQADRAWRFADALARSETDQRLRAERSGRAERWERYRSNIAAAAAALELQQSAKSRRALEETPAEHRDWEWRHLSSQLDGARATLPGAMPDLEWMWHRPILSPSGRQLATVDQDGHAIRLWDTTTCAPAGILRGHAGPVSAMAYSPENDRLVAGAADGTVRLWDTAAGVEVALLRGNGRPVEWLACSPDGRRICALGGGSGWLWDAASGREVAAFGGPAGRITALFMPDGKRLIVGAGRQLSLLDSATGQQIAVLGVHEREIIHLAASPDGERIVSHGDDEDTVRLWDPATGREVAALRGDTEYPGSIAFSPDGARLVTGSSYPDNTVRLWDATTGRLIADLSGHKNGIITVAFDPAGRRLVSASRDQTARLWDGDTGRPIASLRGHAGSLWSANFSPDGTRVVTTSTDQTLRLWDAAAGDLIDVLRGHSAEVRGVAFAEQGGLLVSRSADGESRVWDMELAERNGILRGHENFVYDVAFSPDGTRVASASWDGTARLWDVATGRQTALLRHDPGAANPGIVSSVAWHPGGGQLATVTRGDTITLWDLATNESCRVLRVPTGNWEGDTRAVYNPAGTLLASGSRDGSVRLWDLAAGGPPEVLSGHQGSALDVAFSPDGKQLASVGFDRTVRLWDVATRSPTKVLAGSVTGYRIAYSADGRLIAASSLGGQVHLWDAQTCAELAVLAHGNRVFGLAFSPGGTRLATACGDNTIRLWDLATRQEVCELRGHEAYVHALAFSPDGTRLASASGDSTVRIWDSVQRPARAQPPPVRPGSR